MAQPLTPSPVPSSGEGRVLHRTLPRGWLRVVSTPGTESTDAAVATIDLLVDQDGRERLLVSTLLHAAGEARLLAFGDHVNVGSVPTEVPLLLRITLRRKNGAVVAASTWSYENGAATGKMGKRTEVLHPTDTTVIFGQT
jgi:hypothetical protein